MHCRRPAVCSNQCIPCDKLPSVNLTLYPLSISFSPLQYIVSIIRCNNVLIVVVETVLGAQRLIEHRGIDLLIDIDISFVVVCYSIYFPLSLSCSIVVIKVVVEYLHLT